MTTMPSNERERFWHTNAEWLIEALGGSPKHCREVLLSGRVGVLSGLRASGSTRAEYLLRVKEASPEQFAATVQLALSLVDDANEG